MNTFTVKILAADCDFYEGECESMIVPTSEGQYGIMANHKNIIFAIIPGKLSFRVPNESEFRIAAVSSGLAKVENNEVLVLVDSAEHPDEIDINRAKRAADEAKEELLQKRSQREYRTVQMNLARALTRLTVRKEYDRINDK